MADPLADVVTHAVVLRALAAEEFRRCAREQLEALRGQRLACPAGSAAIDLGDSLLLRFLQGAERSSIRDFLSLSCAEFGAVRSAMINSVR